MIMLLSPISTKAASNVSEDFHPDNASIITDIQLSGALRDMLLNMLKNMTEGSTEKSTTTNTDNILQIKLITSILNGDRLFVTMAFSNDQGSLTPSFIVSLPITEEEWNNLLKNEDLEKSTYGTFDYYKTSEDSYFTKLGNFLIIQYMGNGSEMEHIIDLADNKKTDSLSNNKEYMQMVESYLKTRSFGITLNITEILKNLEDQMQNAEKSEEEKKGITMFENFYGLFQFIGGSIAEKDKTYTFNLKVQGNEEKLKESGLSLNPEGTFTPNLYKKFPPAKPIFYSETFNAKAVQENSEILTKKIFDYYGDEFKKMQTDIGVDIKNMYKLFTKETGIAIQYDEKSVLPYFTFMANVGTDMEEAQKTLDLLVKIISESLKNSKIPKNVYSINTSGNVTKLTLDITQGKNNMPSLPKITITFGILDDGTLVASNYPDIEKPENRSGIELPMKKEENSGFTYINMRNIWDWSDGLIRFIRQNSENALSLNFYQGYYGMLEKIYHWNDLTLIEKNTETQSLLTGTLRTDEKTHSSFKDFIKNMKKSDQDGDGINDYYENFVYHTPVNVQDTDMDGMNDVEELKKGLNPKGNGKLFADISEENYYTKDIALLQQSGIFQGYSDKKFHPEQSITRAEFITAVVKAFNLSDNPKIIFSSNVKNHTNATDLVSDVTDINEWYYQPMMTAFNATLIKGNLDKKTMSWKLRPLDRITRAEAITILSRVSKSLKKASISYSTNINQPIELDNLSLVSNMPFVDVKSSDWFFVPVEKAYGLGIAQGKTNEYFKPQDELNRADAAVLIRRTLEKDIELSSNETINMQDIAEPIEKNLFEQSFLP